jgi:hypothetical protein
MNAPQENAVSSFSVIDDVFTKYQAVWSPVVAFAAGVAKFRTSRTNINALIKTQSSSTKGVTLEKRTVREAMIAAALEVAGCVFAYAFDQGDAKLHAKVDYSESDLLRIRDGEIGPVCQGIHDEADAIVASLANYGVDAPLLADLQAKITAYGGNAGKPRSATGSKKAATASLDGEIVSTRRVLESKIDKLATKFKLSQPDFFNEYMAARVIVDQPGGHKPKNGNGNGNGHSTPTPPPA